MKLSERLSTATCRILYRPYLKDFEKKSPGKILRRSMEIIDRQSLDDLKEFTGKCQHGSGGFRDRAGNPDLYYTLFGCFIADALEIDEINRAAVGFVEDRIREGSLKGIYLNTAAILAHLLPVSAELKSVLREEIKRQPESKSGSQPGYSAFVSLLACYYSREYHGIYRIKKQLDHLPNNESMPSTVTAAMIVLQKSFGRPVDMLVSRLLEFYQDGGGFRAVKKAPVPDLLSTAVALYALSFAGYDTRLIKPDCLEFTDSLFSDGGFGANILDREPDIEYTFYGLLALGSMTD